jgi:HEAT repeat protein
MDVAPRVSTTLAEFGDEAVPAVTRKLDDQYLSSDAAFTLGTFVRGRAIGKSPIGASTVLEIRDTLLKTLEHRSFVTRKAAVNALEYLGPDPKVFAALQHVARTDPYVRSIPAGKRNPAIARDYPVRRAAAAVLEKLEKPARERTP